MSWDFEMQADLGGDNPVYLGLDKNYTCNVAPMYYDAIGNDGIRVLDGMSGSEALPILISAIAKMVNDPNKYEAMNPKNGWGNYEGALELLRDLRVWARNAPMAIFTVQ